MRDYTIFDTATGFPVAGGFVSNNMFKEFDIPGQVIVRGRMEQTHYWDGNAPVEKLSLTASISTTDATTGVPVILSGLPDPCDVMVDQSVTSVTGGEFTMTFNSPGVYMVSVNELLYLYEQWRVTVND